MPLQSEFITLDHDSWCLSSLALGLPQSSDFSWHKAYTFSEEAQSHSVLDYCKSVPVFCLGQVAPPSGSRSLVCTLHCQLIRFLSVTVTVSQHRKDKANKGDCSILVVPFVRTQLQCLFGLTKRSGDNFLQAKEKQQHF